MPSERDDTRAFAPSRDAAIENLIAQLFCVLAQAIREARDDGETEVLVYEGTDLMSLLDRVTDYLSGTTTLSPEAALSTHAAVMYIRSITRPSGIQPRERQWMYTPPLDPLGPSSFKWTPLA